MSKLTYRLDQLLSKKEKLKAESESVTSEIKTVKLGIAEEKKVAKAK
jgi:hypothetical protein